MRWLVFIGLAGCADDAATTPPFTENAAIMVGSATASGVYLGHQRFVTAGHVCWNGEGARALNFTRAGIEAYTTSILFHSDALDLCVMAIDDLALDPVPLAQNAVVMGQRVIVAGHNTKALNDVGVETCNVIDTVRPVADPDTFQPSDLVVPSFAIDCQTSEHGSSGSPVFDLDGALLGVVWTGSFPESGPQTIYVSAVSAWSADAREVCAPTR